jgi:hypothetical protein
VGPKAVLDVTVKRKYIFLAGNRTSIFLSSARSLVVYRLSYPGSEGRRILVNVSFHIGQAESEFQRQSFLSALIPPICPVSCLKDVLQTG